MTIADFCLASFIFNMIKNEMSPLHALFSPLMHDYPHFASYAERLEHEMKHHLEKRPKHLF